MVRAPEPEKSLFEKYKALIIWGTVGLVLSGATWMGGVLSNKKAPPPAATAPADGADKKDSEKGEKKEEKAEEVAPPAEDIPMPPPMGMADPVPMPKLDPVPKADVRPKVDPIPKGPLPVPGVLTLEDGKSYRFDAARAEKGKTHIEYTEVDADGKEVGKVQFATVEGNTLKLSVKGEIDIALNPAFGNDLNIEVTHVNDKSKLALDLSGYTEPHPKVNAKNPGTLVLTLSGKQIAAIDVDASQASREGFHMLSGKWANVGPDTNLTLMSQEGEEVELPAGRGTAAGRKALKGFQAEVAPPAKMEPKKMDTKEEPAPKKVEPAPVVTEKDRVNEKIAELRGKIAEKQSQIQGLEKAACPEILERQRIAQQARVEALNVQRTALAREKSEALALANRMRVHPVQRTGIATGYDNQAAATELAIVDARAGLNLIITAQRTEGKRTPETRQAFDDLGVATAELVATQKALRAELAKKAAIERKEAEERRREEERKKKDGAGKQVGLLDEGAPEAVREAVVLDKKEKVIEALTALEQQSARTRG